MLLGRSLEIPLVEGTVGFAPYALAVPGEGAMAAGLLVNMDGEKGVGVGGECAVPVADCSSGPSCWVAGSSGTVLRFFLE